MKKAIATMALSMVGVLAAACGGGATGGTGGTGGTGAGHAASSGAGGLTADQACADSSAARCARIQACSNGSGITSRYGDIATCEARLEQNCTTALAAPHTGNTPANVEACATALPGESCADLINNNPVAACTTQMGTLADGTACGFAAQCTSAFCEIPKGALCGTCAPQPKVGDPCVTGADCGHDQICVNASSTCTTPVPANGSCDKDNPCGAGLTCVGASATAMGACKASGAKAGDACDPTRKTAADCDRNLGLYCDATAMTCATIAFVADGQPCGLVGDAIVGCKGGGMCVILGMVTQGTCKAPAADGAACDTTVGPPCLVPARCVFSGTSSTAGTCQLPTSTSCM